MKKYILPLVVGYVSVAALAGIVVVPLYVCRQIKVDFFRYKLSEC